MKTLSTLALLSLTLLLAGCFSVDDSPNSNRLRSIEVSTGGLTPAFVPNTTHYVVEVEMQLDQLALVATAEHSVADISINNNRAVSGKASEPIDLVPGSNIVSIAVTPPNGTGTQTYFITVLRGISAAENDAANDLDSSAVSDGTDPDTPVTDSNNGDTSTDQGSTDPGGADGAGGDDGNADNNAGGGSDGSSDSDSGNTVTETTPDDIALASGFYNETHAVTATPSFNSAQLGQSLAMFGSTLVAGAPGESAESGSVYVFQINSSGYSQRQKLSAPKLLPGQQFGASVALGDDLMVIAAPYYSNESASAVGTLYTYALENGQWTRKDQLLPAAPAKGFGSAVALSGNRLAVATLRQNGSGGDVYVYQRVGNAWSLQQRLQGRGFGSNDSYAQNLSLDADSLAVGSFDSSANCLSNTGNPGSVNIYQRNGTQWTLKKTIKADDGNNGDRFGYSLALAGSTLVAGAQCEDGIDNRSTSQGAAYVFQRSGDNWLQTQKLAASDASAHALFGDKVVLSGNTLAVSASYQNGARGAVYVYKKQAGQWLESQTLRPDELASHDRFGWELTSGGGYLAVGAPDRDSDKDGSGAVYLYR